MGDIKHISSILEEEKSVSLMSLLVCFVLFTSIFLCYSLACVFLVVSTKFRNTLPLVYASNHPCPTNQLTSRIPIPPPRSSKNTLFYPSMVFNKFATVISVHLNFSINFWHGISCNQLSVVEFSDRVALSNTKIME